MIARLPLVLKTCRKLGLLSIVRVINYRVACKSGLYQLLQPVQRWQGVNAFFEPSAVPATLPGLPSPCRDAITARAMSMLEGHMDYFSYHRRQIGSPPDWFLDPFSGKQLLHKGHWSKLDEFSGADIKNVWEASRFEWAPLFARAWRCSGDRRYLDTLNLWLHDWVIKNPTNSGPNWKCGQEASIRIINLLLAAFILGTHRQPSACLKELIQLHCSRVLPTIHYALAQNNNHGTSEAAALYIGGLWLLNVMPSLHLKLQAQRWQTAGRRYLEDRVLTLVAEDGSFSQYSVNYHRVMLDTLCQAEIWRREFGDHAFSEKYQRRCSAAVDWLRQFSDDISGAAPNFGANDGARLYSLSSTPYRDFRSSIQLAAVLFNNSRAYPSGSWDEPLQWLGLEESPFLGASHAPMVVHNDGGDVILRNGNTFAMIRFAAFRFRPSHADCLHIDLWHDGQNILRDGGTYSYNTSQEWLDYFTGSKSHNTIQFDDRNQMPRLGRFLFGEWLAMNQCGDPVSSNGQLTWTSAYCDWKLARHRRTVSLDRLVLTVEDKIEGFKEKAVLRWRLAPVQWILEGTDCSSQLAQLQIITDAPVRRLELLQGWESLYYQHKSELPVLEVEVPPGQWTITTKITLKD